MIKCFVAPVILLIMIMIDCGSAWATTNENSYTSNILEWREKSELAQEYLKKSDLDGKAGLNYKACINQRLASKFGIAAYEALIKTKVENESDKQFSNIEENLEEWKELRNCSNSKSVINNNLSK